HREAAKNAKFFCILARAISVVAPHQKQTNLRDLRGFAVEVQSFFSEDSFLAFFCLGGFFSPAPWSPEAAAVFFSSAFFSAAGFFSGSVFSDFSTSSRIDIGALSPMRLPVWMIRVYPPGRALKRGPMVAN